MSEQADDKPQADGSKEEPRPIEPLKLPQGEEVALGMRARVHEGMSAKPGVKGMSAGDAQAGGVKSPEQAPPKPADAADSAAPKKPD